jgi:hypothetical protein
LEWGEAPFHGLTLFLDSKEQSGIVFAIHIRVGENAVVKRPPGAKNLALGRAIGWQKTSSGRLNGIRLKNTTTAFSFVRSDQTDDGEINRVTPVSPAERSKKIYDEFLRSLIFGH